MIAALFIMLLLLGQEKKNMARGWLYGWYLIFCGVTRFVLNWFRYGVETFVLGLTAGNFWSLVEIAFGLFWLVIAKTRAKK